MHASFCLPLLIGLIGQVADAKPEAPESTEARLAFMKTSLDPYAFHASDDAGATYVRQTEPVQRFTNPISGVTDGSVFFWMDKSGRPAVTVQVFHTREGRWLHEFTSLSTAPLTAEKDGQTVWSPGRPGVEFRPVPGAPKPASEPSPRLRQMRVLAEDFAAEDEFRGQSWHQLRLLSKPLVRYGSPTATPTDGAVFSFAIGTNPEAFLLLEERPGKDGPEWQYAFAPMTSYALKATHQGKEVWTLPRRSTAKDPAEPFILLRHQPAS